MRVLFVILLLIVTASCATPSNEVAPDVAEATAEGVDQPGPNPPPSGQTAAAPSETSEADLNAGAPQQAPPAETAKTEPPPADTNPAPDLNAAPPPPETAQAEPPPPAAEEPAAPEVAPEAGPEAAPSATNEKPARITGLDFKANLNGGTVVVRTNHPVQYTTRKNASTNQFIIELPNTSVPKRFQRPYVTKEFSSPIASINAYQSKKGRTARVVVQLREPIEPAVSQDGNVISIAGSGAATGGEQAQNPPIPEAAPETTNANPDQAAASEADQAQTGESKVAEGDEDDSADLAAGKAVGTRGLADFLMGNTKFYGRPLSLELQNADIRDVFRFISEESGLNIVVSDDVVGKVSLKLKKIPWDQALSVVMQAKQLGYVKQGNILRIAPLITLQKESDAAKNLIDAQRLLQPLHVQVFPVSYGKAEDLEIQSRDFLSPRGKAKADKRTNSLVVTDIDENLGRIRALVKRLDTQTPQVLIEAKVVEAREIFNRVVGVNWTQAGSPYQIGTNSTTGAPVNIYSNFQTAFTGSATTQLDLHLGTLDVIGDLTATLQLLEDESLIKVVSAPRIVTLDRVEASITQTTQFPAFSTTPATSTTPALTTVTFQDVQLKLTVTPQVTNDGSVIMAIDLLRQIPGPLASNGTGSARSIDSRAAKTQVLVENGDTIVIGGIYRSDVAESEQGIPWLRKIPILGALFRRSSQTKDKNELVIFLTPRILNRERAFVKGGQTG